MKKIKYVRTFENNNAEWSAFYHAKRWLLENGYSFGSTDIGPYVPIVKGDYNIPQKYKNLSKSDIENLAGVICFVDYRNGRVEIRLFEDPNIS